MRHAPPAVPPTRYAGAGECGRMQSGRRAFRVHQVPHGALSLRAVESPCNVLRSRRMAPTRLVACYLRDRRSSVQTAGL